jgi:hypothetical protein
MNEPADLSKEKRILRTMRFMLAQIIKETAVPAGMRHPLSKGTIEDMRNWPAIGRAPTLQGSDRVPGKSRRAIA